MANGQPLRRNPRPGAAGPGAARRPGTRPGSAARPDGRRAPPKNTGTPLWMWLVLIVLPAGLIGALFFFSQGGDEATVAVEKPQVVDPNERINALRAEVDKMEKDFQRFQETSRSGGPAVKARGEGLRVRIDDWMKEWDGIFEPRRDAEGKLPPELRGYQETRARINMLRVDLLKTTGFE